MSSAKYNIILISKCKFLKTIIFFFLGLLTQSTLQYLQWYKYVWRMSANYHKINIIVHSSRCASWWCLDIYNIYVYEYVLGALLVKWNMFDLLSIKNNKKKTKQRKALNLLTTKRKQNSSVGKSIILVLYCTTTQTGNRNVY